MNDSTAWRRIDDELAGSLLEQRTLLMGGVLDEALGNRLCTGLMVLVGPRPPRRHPPLDQLARRLGARRCWRSAT